MAKTEIIAEPGQPHIIIEREFDAPKELLFRAHTDPDLLAQWYGPRDVPTTVERLEARDGGIWRFISRTPDGYTFDFHGVFHNDPSPEGMVRTVEFSGAPGHVALESLAFAETAGGKTRLRATSTYQSVEDRDAVIASGMESGLNESYERLDELVARTAATR